MENLPKLTENSGLEKEIYSKFAEANIAKYSAALNKQRTLRLLIPLGIFTIGCYMEYNTGTRVTKTCDVSNNIITTKEYSWNRGTGMGWGAFLALLCL